MFNKNILNISYPKHFISYALYSITKLTVSQICSGSRFGSPSKGIMISLINIMKVTATINHIKNNNNHINFEILINRRILNLFLIVLRAVVSMETYIVMAMKIYDTAGKANLHNENYDLVQCLNQLYYQ